MHSSTYQYSKEELPYAKIDFPPEFFNRLKYLFWRCYTPFHPTVRDTALKLKIVKHSGRQKFLLGKIAEGKSVEDFITHCVSIGYGNHFIAWHDEGEIVSMRLVENFTAQYHFRIFADGEIRGHYEYTPECYPILHFKAIGQEDRRHVFFEHFKEYIQQHQEMEA